MTRGREVMMATTKILGQRYKVKKKWTQVTIQPETVVMETCRNCPRYDGMCCDVRGIYIDPNTPIANCRHIG
jgi:hypothetical protein